ncbi:lysozyme inhibitor LprI family protein [uncultured Roseobacter sp.]|uniref:lysozyme inhibitor LprI family protein n=1 Tax=uncultured Roseobacter sp. TaxID=114847 RepID=UPI00261815D4|nr:lysozyme inhibitor LprI family protein [uncultured Roseobacter sp.]
MIRTLLASLAICGATTAALHADPTLECSLSSGSQVETADCLIAAEKAAVGALELIVGFATESAQELDEVVGREVAVPALLASQEAWEDWRDAECDYAGSLFGGGSGTGIEIRSCRIILTRARTQALLERFR